MPKVLLIIPAYNEEKNIKNVLLNVSNLNLDIDIIVVDDGSTDRTREIALLHEVPVISHIHNLGYGAALQTGFKYARLYDYDYVIQFDADGQHDPSDIQLIANELKKSNADIVIGSRFLGRGNFKAGIMKIILIKFMRFLIRFLGGVAITDPTSGLKGLSRRTYFFYATAGNFPNDYPDADLLIKMLRFNYIVTEIPANVRQRNHGKSMHSGLKPIVYFMKILLSIIVVLLKHKKVKER